MHECLEIKRLRDRSDGQIGSSPVAEELHCFMFERNVTNFFTWTDSHKLSGMVQSLKENLNIISSKCGSFEEKTTRIFEKFAGPVCHRSLEISNKIVLYHAKTEKKFTCFSTRSEASLPYHALKYIKKSIRCHFANG